MIAGREMCLAGQIWVWEMGVVGMERGESWGRFAFGIGRVLLLKRLTGRSG